MDIGLFLAVEPHDRSAGQEYSAIVDLAEQCEELGYRSFWIASRHFSPEYAAAPSPLVLLAAAASRTNRIRLGTSIVALPLEDPIRISEDFATLDAISGGRGRLGVGSGDDEPSFAAFGADFEERQGMLSNKLPKLLEILSGSSESVPNLYPPVDNAVDKVALGAQSARGAAWAASLKVGLLQGRSEPNTLDPTASQARAAETYRQFHPKGRVVTGRNVWIGSPNDEDLKEGLRRHSDYLRSRGRPGLPESHDEALKKMNMVSGDSESVAAALQAKVAPIGPDELVMTLDPGGLDAAERSRRASLMAEAFRLKPEDK